MLALLPLLTACGTSYQASIHALNDGSLSPGQYYLLPLDERIDESDLLFRVVRDEVATAFAAQNMPLALGAPPGGCLLCGPSCLWHGRSADLYTWTSFHYRTLYRHGRARRVLVEEPHISTRILYNAHLLIQTAKQESKRNGKQV